VHLLDSILIPSLASDTCITSNMSLVDSFLMIKSVMKTVVFNFMECSSECMEETRGLRFSYSSIHQ